MQVNVYVFQNLLMELLPDPDPRSFPKLSPPDVLLTRSYCLISNCCVCIFFSWIFLANDPKFGILTLLDFASSEGSRSFF